MNQTIHDDQTLSSLEIQDIVNMIKYNIIPAVNTLSTTVNRKFILGVDRSKMRFYDVEQKAQTDLVESGQTPTTDNKFGKKLGQFSDFKI